MKENAQCRILLVDDNDINLEILKEALHSDYPLEIATNGADAIKIALDGRPDLVLLDIMMPEMNGYDVCRRLKMDPGTRDIPVIFLTALKESEDKTKGFEAGAVDYITKPFDMAEVRARVKTHLALKMARETLESQNRMFRELSEKVSRYMALQVFASICRGKQDVKIGSHRKKLTIFFSDIAGFTETTESMQPEDLSRLLNHYLDEMTRIALAHGATMDKYIGDAIMAFMGDPESKGVKNDAIACVKMALAMQDRIKQLQEQWAEEGITKPFEVRMGINTGHCTVGNFGSEQLMMYTIVGGEVNAAARLQAQAEPGQILISAETHALAKEQIYCEKSRVVRLKGISEPVQTFRVVDLKENREGHDKMIRKDTDALQFKLDLKRLDPLQRKETIFFLRGVLDILNQEP